MVVEKTLPEGSREIIEDISKATGVSERLARLLVLRGITDAREAASFMNPKKSDLHDPYLLDGMKEAVERITAARDNGEVIVVYGDYDADGISATAVLYRSLILFGADVRAVVPERENGYGLTEEVYGQVIDEYCPDLIVTVDCGISAVREVEELNDLGIDVIITDHHELPEEIPSCTVINCKKKGNYPFDGLCGAGVAYKLAHALIGEKADAFLDLVAVATVADSMPLRDENRYIVSRGVGMLGDGRCCKNLKILSEVCGLKEISATGVAYSLAPKINAAGRMGDAYSALRLFLTDDAREMRELAGALNEYNISRQSECENLYRSAKLAISEKGSLKRVIVLLGDDWKSGLIGIVAARLVEEYSRPVVLFCGGEQIVHGSARSVENINIFDAINAVRHLTEGFGGHSQAAGVTVDRSRLDEFETALDEYIGEKYDISAFCSRTEVDEIVKSEFDISFAKEISRLEPFGIANKKPLFAVRCGDVGAAPIKYGSPHVTFRSDYIDLIWFNGYDDVSVLNKPTPKYVVFEPNVSVFNHRESLKGYVRSIQPVVFDSEATSAALIDSQISKLSKGKTGFSSISVSEAQKFIDDAVRSPFGTLFVVNNVVNLRYYKNLKLFDVHMFSVRQTGNLAALCVGFDGNLPSGYERVVYLDEPLATDDLPVPSLVVTELSGVDRRGLSADRASVGEVYKRIKSNPVKSGLPCDVAARNDFGVSQSEVVFALRVLAELRLIRAENGYIVVDPMRKANLGDSAVFMAINKE